MPTSRSKKPEQYVWCNVCGIAVAGSAKVIHETSERHLRGASDFLLRLLVHRAIPAPCDGIR